MSLRDQTTLPRNSRRTSLTTYLTLTTALTGFAVLIASGTPSLAQSAAGVASTVEDQDEPSSARRSAQDDVFVLDPIVITGVRTAGEAPPPYAGGQVAKGSRVGILGNQDFMSTPFNTVGYTSDYIANREAQDIGSVIGPTDPSVYVPSTRNIYETFYIRGFPSAANDVTFGGLIGMAPNMRASTEFAERIEVLKGPSAFLNGMPPGGSVGGSVNIVPKRATDDPITRLTTTFASDSQWGVHADFGRRFGENNEWGVRVNGVLRDGNTAVDNETHGMRLGSVALDYRGERARFSLDYYRQREELEGVNYFGLSVGPAVTALPSPRSGSHSLAAPWTFNTNDTSTIVLRGEVDLTDSITAYGAWGRRSGGYDALINSTALLNNAGDISVSANRQIEDKTDYSGEAGLRGHFTTGSVGHDWNLAFTRFTSSASYTVQAFPNLTATNIHNLNFGIAPDLSGFANRNPYAGIDQELTSVAVSDTLSMFDERLQLTLGLRYQDVRNKQYLLPSRMTVASYSESRVSPAIAGVFKATDNVSLYANYIQGLSQGGIAPITAANPGEVMPPYQTEQFEAGVKWDLGNFATTLSVFQIAKPSAFVDPMTNIYGVYGEQRNRGVELNVFGEVRPGLRLLGGLSYTEATVTKAQNPANVGNTAAGVPAFMAKAGLEYDVAAVPGLTLSGNVNYISKRYISDNNAISLPDYATLDVGASYRTEVNGNPFTLRASVLNVTDTAYWDFGSLQGGYGAPRTFRLSASMEF